MSSRSRASVVCALLLPILLCMAAQAWGRTPGKREQARIAKQQNALGLKLYQQGDYEGAINAFWTAYQFKQAPQLLFNLAQAYRQSGDQGQARELYQRFLDDAPDSPLRVEAETHLGEMKKELERRERAEQQAAAEVRLKLQPPAPLPPPPPPPTPFYRKPWFYGVLGGVAAATVLGVGLGVGLRQTDPSTDLGVRNVSF